MFIIIAPSTAVESRITIINVRTDGNAAVIIMNDMVITIVKVIVNLVLIRKIFCVPIKQKILPNI